jgi:transposase, IS5 family
MRQPFDFQLSFGDVDISKIQPNPKSRDEIDKAVSGLQYIYINKEIREKVFKLLEESISPNISKRTGRRGMELWKILVLGVMRQTCSWNYDTLHNMANNHSLLRQLLGHAESDWDKHKYGIQTIKDNVSLLQPVTIDQINEIVVDAGHKLLGGKKKDELHASVDSFVVKSDVHFPTDINLLYDSMRKSISLIAAICSANEVKGWRQSDHHICKLKTELRRVQKAKHSGKSTSEEKIKIAHTQYILKAKNILEKVKKSISILNEQLLASPLTVVQLMEIDKYIKYAEHQIDLIERRVLNGEKIPHQEKIFSIFEPHTRWISKGKAGVPVEFGLPVSIIKDQHGYILGYEIMENTCDVDVAVSLTKRIKEHFSAIISCSFDKGFWSPANRIALAEFLDIVVLPKKGRLNKIEQAEENAPEYINLRKKHSSVESSINGLNHTGLEKCYDHGLTGFKRCVSLSILARNLHSLGKDILEKETKQKNRKLYTKAA